MSRYNNSRDMLNDSPFYKSLKERRGVKELIHHSTPQLKHPSAAERASIQTTGHIWKYGDRFYTLAQRYYSDTRFWWVIAWYNGVPTEADVLPGDFIDIPINLQDALGVLGVG